MAANKKKKENSASIAGLIFNIIGMLALISAGLWIGYNIWDSHRAEAASAQIAEKLEHVISENSNEPEDTTSGISQTATQSSYKDMPTVNIDGYDYIGIIEIPAVNMSLPVMYECDEERLRISPCRYYGSYYTDDLVICAHNYTTAHFSSLTTISMGVDVYFTNVEGEVIHYIIVNRENLKPDQVSEMIYNAHNSAESTNEWDLTLYTCTTGAAITRTTVRCERAGE